MNYIKIVDVNKNTLAYLDKVINPIIKEQINGEYVFTFTAIIEELKTDYINHNNFIEIEDNLFQISKYTKERTQDNKLLCNVLAEHISYKLIDDKLDNFILENTTPQIALDTLLQNTNFTTDIVDVVGTNSIILENEVTKREVLNEIANVFGGEFKFDKYKISLLTERGQNTGIQFIVGKNIKGIKKTVDNTIKDDEGNPKISYEIDILELNELDEFKGLEGFDLGDTVRIIDEDLDIDIFARIIEYEYNPIQKINSRIVLSNFIDNITNFNVELKKNGNLVSQRSSIWDRAEIISPNKTISTQILEGEINTLNNEIKAGLGTVHVTNDNGILITDQPIIEQSTKALRLLGGVLAISNSKDANGNFVWRTFGTGDGFVADEIISGKILTSLIKIVGNSDVPNAFYWDENGLRIHKINADNTIDNNNYIHIDNTGFKFYKNGSLVINIGFDSDNVATKTFANGLCEITNDNGFVAYKDSTKREFAQLYGGGIYRVNLDQGIAKEYFYERHLDVVGDYNSVVYHDDIEDGIYEGTNAAADPSIIENDLNPYTTVQLPEYMIGKNFKILAEIYTGDGIYIDRFSAKYQDPAASYSEIYLEIQDVNGNVWDGMNLSTMPQSIKDTGQFKIKSYFWYRWRTKVYVNDMLIGYNTHVYASKFKVKIDVIA